MLVAFDKGLCPQYLVLAFYKMDGATGCLNSVFEGRKKGQSAYAKLFSNGDQDNTMGGRVELTQT